MLDNADTERGEKFAAGDVYDQVATILKNARPKIQKWISDAETEDSESLDTFLQINDQINTVLNRYEAFQKGDYSFSSNPIPAELGGSSAKNNLSLIDFDDSAPSNSGSAGGVNDLAGLFGSEPPTESARVLPPSVNNATRPPMSSQPISPQLPQQFGSIMLPGTPKPSGSAGASRIGSPNYFGQGSISAPGMATSGMGMGSMSPQPPPQQTQQQQKQPGAPTTSQAQGKDPFADLVGLF